MPMTNPRGFLCPPFDGLAVENAKLLSKVDDNERKLISDVLLGRAGECNRSGSQDQMRSGDGIRLHQLE